MSELFNYTPGPWIYKEQGDAQEFCLLRPRQDGKLDWLLSFRDNTGTVEQQKANATLISKSPLMHGALFEVYGYLLHNMKFEDRHTMKGQAMLANLRSLIADAAGMDSQELEVLAGTNSGWGYKR